MEAIPLDHPFRAHADVSREESLQRSLVQAEAGDEVVDFQDAAIPGRGVDDLCREGGGLS